jgi:ribonuclease BN (tRNA processing enzyme)
MRYLFLLLVNFYLFASDIRLEVLGSGGPEATNRASSSYIIWEDNKAKFLIDFGAGSLLRFSESGAKIEDLEAIFITHMHIDHTIELVALIKAGYFTNRERPLTIYGPSNNEFFPSITEFLSLMFDENGPYRYMRDVLTPQSDSFQIVPIDLPAKTSSFQLGNFSIHSVGVHHGILPALAYRFDNDKKSIVFSGDTNAKSNNLHMLANNADLLIAHHAIAQKANPIAKNLHMTPSKIAEVAAQTNVKKLLLSHRMKRTFGKESQTTAIIKQVFNGQIIWAEDHLSITP